MRDRLLHAMIAIAILAALSGCSFSERISRDAVSYNVTVEDMQNRLLLLNVLRAMKRRPMYFTSLTQIRGSLRGTVGTGSDLPTGGDAMNIFKFTPNTAVTSNPTFDVAVLDSEKFMRGITKPIETSTLTYYLSQGWPMEMILHLCVRKIVDKNSDGVVHSYLNYPENDGYFGKFQDFASRLKKIELTSEAVDFGPPLSADEARENLEHLLKARTDQLSVVKRDGNFQIQRSRTVVNVEIREAATAGGPSVESLRSEKAELRVFGQSSDEEQADEGKTKRVIVLYLRSPEAIIYYLGEVMRRGIAHEKTLKRDDRVTVNESKRAEQGWPEIHVGGGKYERLFVARPRWWLEAADVLVKYGPGTFVIPSNTTDAGRSMHCLSFLSQILSLYKSSDELPTTRAVIAVGG